MSPLGKAFVEVCIQDLQALDDFVKQLKANNDMKLEQALNVSFDSSIQQRLEVIKNSGIEGLKTRQDDLVRLIVDIVNHETHNGKLTRDDVFPTSQDYWTGLMLHMDTAGFKMLGSGFFSVAFEHELLPQRVIKVGFKVEDSGATYAAWCRQNQHLFAIPKIHDLQRHASCYTVVLDKLLKYTGCVKEQHDQYGVAMSGLYGKEVNAKSESQEKIAETVSHIRSFFEGMARFDLHRENIMIDPKTSNIIITDPVSFTNGDVARLKPANGFMVDLEEIIEAIELAKQKKLIDKAKRRHMRKQPEYIKARKEKLKERKRKEQLAGDKAICILVDDNISLKSNRKGCDIVCGRIACTDCPVYKEDYLNDLNLGDIRKLYNEIPKHRKDEIRLDLPKRNS